MALRYTNKQTGFTIVELLIVIVVIGILAAITIVAYNGIQNRAQVASLSSDLANSIKQLEISKVDGGTTQYPATLPSGVKFSTGTTSNYSRTTNGLAFCLSATNNGISQYVTNASPSPQTGQCTNIDGLISWWPLNGSTNDIVGTDNGTLVNNPTPSVGQNGISNSGYGFVTGSNQYITMPGYSSKLYGLSAMTISGWVKPPATPGAHMGYFGVRTGSTSFYVLQGLGGNSLECRYTNTSSAQSQPAGVTITPNIWQLITFVYDGANVTCYVNSTGSSIAASGTMLQTLGPFAIATSGSSGFPLTGQVDDVRVYTRALSATDVQALYNAGAQ